MRFKVNPGQAIPQFRHEPGKDPERVVYREGDFLEGPPAWAEEFQGRMTPVDDEGNPLPGMELNELTRDMATAKAHEKLQYLQDLIKRSPSLEGTLKGELERAQRENDEAQKFAQERKAAIAASKPKDDPRGPKVTQVAQAPQEGPVAVERDGR